MKKYKKRLSIVDYAVVEGEPGCGKSISVYQAAYDLFMQGYAVYRYISKNASDSIVIPQSNEISTLVIIDDAQNLPQFLIDQVLSQSKRQAKVIVAFTKLENDAHSYSEPIRLTNFDAVSAIAQYYKKRKQEILPIVQQFDKGVGDDLVNTSFERRLKQAADQNTPWLFNYTLRGGWNTVNGQFQDIYKHNKCGLLSAIIAFFQVLRLDGVVDFKWLQTYIQKFDKTISWTDDDLNYLIKKRLIASHDDVRIVHIESARSIIHCFYKVADNKSMQLICKILEDGYNNQSFNEQGLVWLQDVTFSFAYDLTENVFTESLLDSVFSGLDSVEDEDRRGFIVYFLERMYHLHREKNGKYYFNQNEDTVARWISTASSKNAYPYAQLVNALNNERNNTLKNFVSKMDIESLLRGFTQSVVEDLYVWSRLLERISCAYDNEERTKYGEMLIEPLVTKSQAVTKKNVDTFYSSLSGLYFINTDLIIELLTNKIEVFHSLWEVRPEDAIDALDFYFLANVCGLPFFSYHRATKAQRGFSKRFVNALPVKPVADFVSHSLPRYWQTIQELGYILYRENKRKYSQIITALDYNALSRSSSSLWKKTNGDLHFLFSFIASGDRTSAQKFLEANEDTIEELGALYIEVLPEQAIKLYKKGVKLRLFENCWNSTSLNALKALHNASEDDYEDILNSEVEQFVNKIDAFCNLDFDTDRVTLFDIVSYLQGTYPPILSKVVAMLNCERMSKGKLTLLKSPQYSRKSKKQLNAMIDLLIEYSDESTITNLRVLKEQK